MRGERVRDVGVRYGEGAVHRVPELVAGAGARRVLLVCGTRSFEASGAAAMLPALRGVAEVRRWDAFRPNPDAADLAGGLAEVARFRPDLVLGVGGGSAMDMAKLLCAFPPGTAPDPLAARIRAGEPVTAREPRLLLAPTTSGSGSEATHFAVVYLGEEKFSVAGPALRPDLAVLDPALTRSGSPYQRATSGIDAVAQAIESRWAVAATPASRRWARHALRLLLGAIEAYVRDPAGASARAMAIGSHLAGRAIDISKTTAPHALSYAITKRYGVSHGHAVALTLGGFLAAHAAAGPELLRADPDTHRAAMAEILARLGVVADSAAPTAADGAAARDRWADLMKGIGLDPGLAAAGAANPAEREALAAAVNAERLGNNPVAFTTAGLADLLARLD